MPYLTHRQSTALLMGLTLFIAACSSAPKRGDRDRPERPQGQQNFSGTIAQPIGLLFTDFDLDKDKVTSTEELATGISSSWTKLSTMGSVSAITYANWSKVTLGSSEARPTFMMLDKDFNGVLTPMEFEAGYKRAFNRLDKNQDGRVTRDEMITQIQAPQGRSQRGQGQESGGRQGRGGGGGGDRPPR